MVFQASVSGTGSEWVIYFHIVKHWGFWISEILLLLFSCSGFSCKFSCTPIKWAATCFLCVLGIPLPDTQGLSVAVQVPNGRRCYVVISLFPSLRFCSPSRTTCHMWIEKICLTGEGQLTFRNGSRVMGSFSALAGSMWDGSSSRSSLNWLDLNWIAVMYWIKVSLKFMKLSFFHYRIKGVCTEVNESGFPLIAGCLLHKLNYSHNYLQFKLLFINLILRCVFESVWCAN